jgi:hypothetical protein
MTYKSIFRIGALLLMCVFATGKTAQAQGWTWGSFWQDGNPAEPYASDGNYVSSFSSFFGDEVVATINYPGVGSVYRIEGFGVSDDFRYGKDISPSGNFHRMARGVARTALDTFVVLEETLPFVGGNRSLHLNVFKLQNPGSWPNDGLVLRTDIFAVPGVNAFARTMQTTANGDFVVLGSAETAGNHDVLLAKVSKQGPVLWANVFPGADNETAIGIASDGADGWFVLKTVTPGTSVHLMHIDPNGNLLSDTNLTANTSDVPVGLTATADGNLVLTGLNPAGNLFLQKINPAGATLWRQDFATPDQELTPYSLLEDVNGDIVVLGTRTNLVTTEQDGWLMKFDAAGAPIWERRIGRNNRSETMTVLALCPDGGYLLGGKYRNQNSNHAYVVKTDANGIISPGRIFGNIFRDFDVDCSNTPGDLPLENRIVRAFRDSAHVYFGSSDALGNYEIECDTGNYVISLFQQSPYWEPCANDLPIHIGYLDTAVVDFALQATIDCPYMTVEHGMLNARPCDTTTLFVAYCNIGTITADGAYLEVTLDSMLAYVSSTIQPSAINGNVLTFPLGDVAPEDCGQLDIEVAVDCAAEIGQIVCTEAHIYPDSLCQPVDPSWSGAYVEVEAECHGDSVLFRLKNTGSATMSEYLEYIVIEDAVLLRSGAFKLTPGETMEVKAPADGSTWRLSAGQEPGAPGFSSPTVAVEGCVEGGGPFSTGFFNQFSENDADDFSSSFCIPVSNSYDPNDKQAFPTGFDAPHNIFANTEIEYMIRFQNTGTDTAFRVILLDTLSALLDPATFRPGASSHPYKFELTDSGVLRFTFQPIALPHNGVNEAGSNGFVTFRIAQKRDNPVGALIENRAGIYFDFNLPVITNTVFHTVHAPWLKLVSVDQPDTAPKLTFQAFPNPFAEQVTVHLEGAEIKDATLRLFSADGRLVLETAFEQNQLTLDRKGLPAGMYFFSVLGAGRVLGSGRLVAE